MDLAATAGGGNAGAAAMDAASEPAGAFFPSPLLDGEPGRHGSLFGSSLLKQPREQEEQQDPCRLPKMAKTESFLPPKSSSSPAHSLLRSSSHSLFPEGQQMLSFSQSPAPPSPPRQEALLLCGDGSLPYYHHHHHHLPPISASPASYVRAPGMSSASMNLHGGATMAGAKGYFTPSQWVELEHQAMIYKCLDANVPIPPSLLISIRKSLYPSAYAAYSTGSMRPGAYGWGSFQLGFTGNTDPEPGRCRRTDGKKWRCTRDAVADQKYCERHLNRGRHRSRKPVEGQTGQAKAMSAIARSPASLAAVSGSGSSNCSSISQKHLKSFQPASTEPSPSQLNRISLDKGNVPDPHSLPFATTQNSKVGDAHFLVSKQHNPFEETSPGTDFGLNCTSSLLATSRTSSYPLRSFMEEWPNSHSDGLNPSWPGTDEDPSDRTQLSMSIPIHSDLPSHSPTQDKMGYSSLKLEEEFDGVIHMGLGMGNNSSQKHTNLVPISWESSSMGGPLGEVLNNTCNSLKDSTIRNTTSSLNLATTGWDTSPPESSPTGVLQKTAFCSLSGSTGSSPRLENFNSHESSGSLHDHLLGSTLFNPATIPLL